MHWIRELGLVVSEIESILSHACELLYLYQGRVTAEKLPASLRTPYELMIWTRPPRAAHAETGMDQYAHGIARWLVLCMPGDKDLQEDVVHLLVERYSHLSREHRLSVIDRIGSSTVR